MKSQCPLLFCISFPTDVSSKVAFEWYFYIWPPSSLGEERGRLGDEESDSESESDVPSDDSVLAEMFQSGTSRIIQRSNGTVEL